VGLAGLFSKKRRIVVANLLVAVAGEDGRALLPDLADATRRIAAGGADFTVASTQVARACELLLGRETSWSHAAHWGEVFDDEGEASAYADESFADASSRYLSEGAAVDQTTADREGLAHDRTVVMLTIAYEGEEVTLETPADNVVAVHDALATIVALHRKDALLVAHLHVAPADAEERLTDERLLVSFPELMSL
jgi:hypothetical protein